MTTIEAMALVEGAYALEVPERDWLRQAAERIFSNLPEARHAFGWRMSLREGRPVFHEAWLGGVEADPVETLQAIHDNMTPAQNRALFRSGTLRGTLNENLARLGDAGEMQAAMDDWHGQFGADDMIAFGSFDALGHGISVGVSVAKLELREQLRQTQERVGIHLSAGMRLRRLLGRDDPLARAELVLETDGRIAHAHGEARSSRAALRDAARRIDRARTRAERERDESLAMWQGLVEGRWSLIDHVDSDGRRYYVAVANPGAAVPERALTLTEAQVVAMAVAGEPNKLIAYSLGLATSTVGGALTQAMRKLGTPTRVDLIRVGQRLLTASDHRAPQARAGARR